MNAYAAINHNEHRKECAVGDQMRGCRGKDVGVFEAVYI